LWKNFYKNKNIFCEKIFFKKKKLFFKKYFFKNIFVEKKIFLGILPLYFFPTKKKKKKFF